MMQEKQEVQGKSHDRGHSQGQGHTQANPKMRKEEIHSDMLVRILDKDIPGEKKVYIGLMAIKGVSWGMSNAICKSTGIDKKKKIAQLSKDEIDKIEKFIQSPSLPSFLFNRRKDIDTGKDLHLSSTDLELRKEFDIKLLKKIRSYRGLRHSLGQPSRGQRTKSHFRRNKKSKVAVKSKSSPRPGKA
jgi:small subunit ribosomal protein S13